MVAARRHWGMSQAIFGSRLKRMNSSAAASGAVWMQRSEALDSQAWRQND